MKMALVMPGVGHDVLKKSDKYPCAVVCSGVGNNSIHCSQCMLLVHKRFIGITLVAKPNYVCRRCNGKARPIDNRTVTWVDVNGTKFDVEATFCYLGDMLWSGKAVEFNHSLTA